ncbi:MAG: MATE family efflux transporter [Candidatus Methanomethylophilaceae archaeon]|nr:MATE family efflux transporter [Candidatus Methanomethylophilaceae archaeon]
MDERELTDDARTLLGNPRKALVAMAIPMIIATIVQSANNMIDAIWVAGLGTAALAATGVAFPYFFIVMGIGNGIGVGASQALSRRLGAGDYEGTNRVASQALVMSLAAGTVVAVAMLLIVEPALIASGAGDYLEECMDYTVPIFIGIPIIVLSSILSGLLRSEGASRRSMYIQLIGAGLNIVLDPIFIYIFGWGVAGAAWATILAMSIGCLLGLYWYFVRKDTFVRIPLRGFRFDRAVDADILRVGIPASMEMIVMSLVMIVVNQIILLVDPVDGIAIYSTGWRVLDMLMIPAMALGFSVVPVCAAAYGTGRMDKFRDAYRYCIKLGVGIMTVVMVVALIVAPYMVSLFTYSDGTAHLADEMVMFVRIGALFLPTLIFGMASAGMFQSLGMGIRSLTATVIMNVLRVPICLFATTFGSLTALWVGMTVSEILGASIVAVWAVVVLRDVIARRGTASRDH